MSNNNSLLPINATRLLRDLESVGVGNLDLETLNRYVNNPTQAPENILPWLAWAVSVDDWSDNWPLDVRRNVIKASIEVHRRKGTIGALKKALEAFNYSGIQVEEWFNYGGEPYFFKVFFNVTKPGFDFNLMSEALKVIEGVKNARSHLESLIAYLSAELALISIGSVIISKEVTSLKPVIYDYDDELKNISSVPILGTFFITKEITTIYPTA